MVISTFSGRVQFTALSISFQFMRMARAKFPKMSLGDVLKEVIEWGSITGSAKSEICLKKVNIRNLCKMFQEIGAQ